MKLVDDDWLEIHHGDCRDVLAAMPAESIHAVVTSPPYFGLRDYGLEPTIWTSSDAGFVDGSHEHDFETLDELRFMRTSPPGSEKQASNRGANAVTSTSSFCPCGAWRGVLGLEPSVELYVEHIVDVFRAVKRVLRRDGTLWLNLGDSYNGTEPREPNVRANGDFSFRGGGRGMNLSGLKPKDLIGVPWRVAFALQADGWWIRRDIIWDKPNPMPESIRDRPTSSHEYVFLMSKAERYFYDADAIAEPATSADEAKYDNGRNGHGGGESHAGQGSSTRKFREPRPSGWMDGDERHDGIPAGRYWPGIGTKAAAVRHPGDEQRPIEARVVEGQRRRNVGGRDDGFTRMPGGEGEWRASGQILRNARSVWRIATAPYPDAHFATFPPELPRRAILAGTSAKGACPECGSPWIRIVEREGSASYATGKAAEKRDVGLATAFSGYPDGQVAPMFTTLGWAPSCSHFRVEREGDAEIRDGDFEIIATPVGGRNDNGNPKPGRRGRMDTGRRGLDRPRADVEGIRPITRFEQRHYADQIRAWPASRHIKLIERVGETAFEHYIRTDRSGARPLPAEMLEEFVASGWLKQVVPPAFTPLDPIPCRVLDPFAGSGTVGMVAQSLSRKAVLIDANADYLRQQLRRAGQVPAGL